ncbi:MAG: nuclear transport factor 2 family protein [Gaiellaceae bacterium]
MATATTETTEVGRRFVDALGRRDWDAVRALLAEDVKLRALVPKMLREEDGADAVIDRFRFWWDKLDDFRVLDSGADEMAGLAEVRYRFAGHDAEDGEVCVEQQCFLVVEDGRIAVINSVCSGFRPL